MARENKTDIIQEMAESLMRKLLKKEVPVEAKEKAFIIFCEETTDVLRGKVLNLLPNEEVISATAIEKTTDLANCKAIVLIAPSIDLAAKITTLQADCPLASLVIKALFANKRVILLATGALVTTDALRPGLKRAVEELRCKLTEMGVEFTDLTNLVQILNNPVAVNAVVNEYVPKENSPIADLVDIAVSNLAKKPENNSLGNVEKGSSYALPVIVYPVNLAGQHPSQFKMASKDELTDFVDFLQTKQCTMEKGKPCDKCDICNTLGF
jgi:hypothetical protein